ncbi:MAG TPA: hypothetical protein VFF59_04340, partial [Anaerolineae bacterium]|nr:hypothetical protein [Anaerolineae bacterium]
MVQMPRETRLNAQPGWAEIPVNDPVEALRFCRKLARLLGDTAPLEATRPTAAPQPVISIVTPVFDERENL